MYITYETKQYSDHHIEPMSLAKYTQPPRQFFNLPRPEFMPSLLVRISDMQVVQGSTVSEGYCALSYSWSWSGDLIKDGNKPTTGGGKTNRIDQGKHKIIYPARSIRQHPRGRKRIPARSKHVKFEGLIQQICKDFNIKYIWYDQMCINQKDKEEKYREMHRMHQIYSSAYCTVALVPEFHSDDDMGNGFVFPKFGQIIGSEWYKRLWTLEEAFMAKRILFVGRDMHSWWYSATNVEELSSMCKSSGEARKWNASTILHYAHMRTSSNEHDRVFALANLFPEIMDEITISYDQPIEDLLLHFYRLLAKKDISILFFGAGKSGAGDSTEENTASFGRFKKYLPTWTGKDGTHYTGEYAKEREINVRDYSIDGRYMRFICGSISSDNNNNYNGTPFYTKLTLDKLPPRDPSNWEKNTLFLAVKLPGSNITKNLMLGQIPTKENPYPEWVPGEYIYGDLDELAHDLQRLSHFFPIKQENLLWSHRATFYHNEEGYTKIFFDLTEPMDASSHCVMLSGIRYGRSPRCPIVRQLEGGNDDGHYKAIGNCYITNMTYFFSGYLAPEQHFVII